MRNEILVVDDDSALRERIANLLRESGHDVATAEGGFAALEQLRLKKWILPDVIISDLEMPEMSGFEFLSILRRRFPKISVIAMSSAYTGNAVPDGVVADAFFTKGQESDKSLLKIIADLFNRSVERANARQREPAPVWIPRNGKDANGNPFIIVNCTQCLRSFPLTVAEEGQARVRETTCVFCHNMVRYIIDFSPIVVSTPRNQESDSRNAREMVAA